MFSFDRLEYLLKYNESSVKRGMELYKSGAVVNVSTGQDSYDSFMHVKARVKDGRLFGIDIIFNKEYEYLKGRCNCDIYNGNDYVCEHVAAVYYFLKNSPDARKTFENFAARDFIEGFMDDIDIVEKQKMKIEYTIESCAYQSNVFGNLSLKVGIDKMYIAKNIRQFLETAYDGGVLEFGKSFIFNSKIHEFKDEDKKIFELIYELYSAEKTMKSDAYNTPGSIFNGKYVKLNDTFLVKFLKLMGTREFSFKNNDVLYSSVKGEFEEIPFEVEINKNGAEINAEIKYEDDCIFFKKHGNIVFSNNKLYIIDKKSSAYNFLSAARLRRVKRMIFSGENSHKFLSIIPEMIDEKNIIVHNDIADKYVSLPLEAEVYLDKYKRGISIKTKFKYGEEIIDPITSGSQNPFVIRNYPVEEKIISLIEDSGFKVMEDRVYLDDMDRVYIFFRDIVPLLNKCASIYYTKEVKDMYIGRIKGYRSYARFSGNGNILDIGFDIEGFDSKEIMEILRAIKEKKKYHKLKGGRLVSLEGEVGEELLELLEVVDKDEINDNGISLSKYRAVGLFERLRESVKGKIENNAEVEDIIKKIKNPELMNFSIPEKFNGVLRDYQAAGFKWLKSLEKLGLDGILADDMGLGKTLQVIALIYDCLGNGTSIVVAPSSLIFNWDNEIKKFAPEIKALVVSGDRKSREEMLKELPEYDIIITSYPLIRRDIDLYEEFEFRYCIIDEAQHIKNPESINAASVKRINSKTRFALTGTPMENSLIELWSIFDFLMPGYLLSKNKFNEKFERTIYREEDPSAAKELRRQIAPFILRRKKKDVLKELPDKIETKLICSLTPEQEKLYTAYIIKTKNEVMEAVEREGFERNRIQILSAITRLRQICCHPSVFVEDYTGGSGKIDLLEELLDELIDGEHRILLFSQFTSLLQIIKELLKSKGIGYLYLDGDTPVKDRPEIVERFNSGEGSVFLISLKAGGTGLNLTSADTVIHFDPWWNPAVEDQATDRAHRIGQENVVQVFKLITRDTIEEKIFELQMKKKELIDSVIHEGETYINKLSEAEILDLFRL